MRQYRLFRAHVNFETDSKFYPYDSQKPSLKLRSLDYGRDLIQLRTRMLNSLNRNSIPLEKNNVNVIDGFDIPIILVRIFIHFSVNICAVFFANKILSSTKTMSKILNGVGYNAITPLKLSTQLWETTWHLNNSTLYFLCKEMNHFTQWRYLYRHSFLLFWHQLDSYYQVNII